MYTKGGCRQYFVQTSEFANVAKKNFRKFMSYTQIRNLEIFFFKSQNRENAPTEK
jgi:hypothetical protein